MGWLAGRDHTVELQEYPIKHHDWMVAAVTQQQRIGWSAAIRGFLSVEWRYLASLPEGENDATPDK